MAKYTASFLGKDGPGIVATISSLFGEIGCNIEAVSQTLLCGEFAAIYVVEAPETVSINDLKDYLSLGLEKAKIDLSIIVRPALNQQWGENLPCEPFVVTVDGPDKPGLIGAISRIFGMHGVNIETLTAILGAAGSKHALFAFEIMVPENVDINRVRRELNCEAQKMGMRVSVQHRNIFEAVHRIASY